MIMSMKQQIININGKYQTINIKNGTYYLLMTSSIWKTLN